MIMVFYIGRGLGNNAELPHHLLVESGSVTLLHINIFTKQEAPLSLSVQFLLGGLIA